jgi:peptide/nickel transport system substrate-binding protein
MGKLGRRALVLLLAALSMSVVLAACGGDDDDNGGTGGGGTAKEGGSITISQTSQPDFMDPALTYTVNGIEPLWLVYTPLLTYPRTGDEVKDALLIPGLAKAMPEISKDGKTYKLTLRPGLKYSDGTPVKANDFEHAVKRVLNLESGGSAFFLGITGAQDYVDAGKCDGDIKGITADDKTVQGHGVGAEPAVRAREERELPGPRSRDPGRPHRQDHHEDREERRASGAGRDLG